MIYIYDQYGKILQAINSPDEYAVHYGEFVIVSNEVVTDATHFVDLASLQLVEFPIQPSAAYEWDWQRKEWRFSAEALTREKERKRAEITAARDAEERGGFSAFGKTFDSDEVSIQRLNGAAQAAQFSSDSFSIDWTCQDNSVLTMSKSMLLQIPSIIVDFANALHVKARTLKAQIDAATTLEQVDAVAW